MESKIWFDDITVLFNTNLLLDIIPTISMTNAEKINSITRFTFYLAILLSLIRQNYIYLYIFIIPTIISYVLYLFVNKEMFYNSNSKGINNSNNENNNSSSENNNSSSENNNSSSENQSSEGNTITEQCNTNTKKNCQSPTVDNPLMNIMLTDNLYDKRPACNIGDENILKSIDNKIMGDYKDRLYNDTTSIYNKRVNQRPFYSMPNTQVPNDQGNFAKWLYETPVGCAESDDGLLKMRRSCAFNYKNSSELKSELKNELKAQCQQIENQ